MELSKTFEFRDAEKRWYEHWQASGHFHSRPDGREPYTVVIPPPNVTGILHMGHCLNNTIQDILVRRARMQGYNACWVPGTDHASIATEAKVVQMLRERGVAKSSLSREAFLEHAWEWKEKYGGIILSQLRKLGCSLDWERTTFTMDPGYHRSVIRVFNELYAKGAIYRGKRMINWDPKARTALSDEEVIFREVQSKLYHLRYALEAADGSPSTDAYITIATVRPETILGDTAIAVNPQDERYRHLVGRHAFVPLVGRRIPIIADEYVAMDFGTGALKVTPAHDMNDHQLGQKHGLEVIDILNDDGTLATAAGLYVGLDRFEARQRIAPDLEAAGSLVKVEDYTHQVGFSERTDVVVEPRLSLQWWLDMKRIATPALDAVQNGEIRFHPAKYRNLYRHWMENIRDWCISRQLWWGHRIPAWYDGEGRFVVAMDEQEARTRFREQHGVADPVLHQDEDCLDTWFSSWLWPFEVFHGLSDPGNAEVKYYYPTNTLVTAPEIIFFWVARMIMAGYEFMGEKPFRDVYFTGIVRDRQGRKMSKQLGNSPDLLAMIDEIGADAVRFGILISSPAGNDLLWDPAANEQGRHFTHKVWNALKLVRMWKDRAATEAAAAPSSGWANRWFRARLDEAGADIDRLLAQFRLSEALKTIYSLIWDDFCSWYLEWVKPAPGTAIPAEDLEAATGFFEELMQILHPFLPFVTEEAWHALRERSMGDDICVSHRPDRSGHAPTDADKAVLGQGERLKAAITGIRDARNKARLKSKDTIHLHAQTEEPEAYGPVSDILCRQVNAASLGFATAPVPGSLPVVIGKDRFHLVAEGLHDDGGQALDMQRELEYLRGFLASVERKLANERFVQNAKPEVVEMERRKQADAEAKIRTLEQSLTGLG
jgi:valyl-tRNA synthetase